MVKFALNQNSEKFEILENLNEIHKKACILASIYDFFVDRNKHIITSILTRSVQSTSIYVEYCENDVITRKSL